MMFTDIKENDAVERLDHLPDNWENVFPKTGCHSANMSPKQILTLLLRKFSKIRIYDWLVVLENERNKTLR